MGMILEKDGNCLVFYVLEGSKIEKLTRSELKKKGKVLVLF